MEDLKDLRARLDQTDERIVGRLKDRSRFPLNSQIYKRGAIPIRGKRDVSLLQFAIEGMERYHASLGRYEYKDQQPLLRSPGTRSSVKRSHTDSGISAERIDLFDDLVGFYTGILPRLCRKGNDPRTYGESAYIDADILELIHERINTVGRYVAESKLSADPEALKRARTGTDAAALKKRLRDPRREESVIRGARAMAKRYGLNGDTAARVFAWLIDKTLEVEVEYLTNSLRML